VALKILRAEPDHFDEALARFEREVRATTELSHPNTIRIFDYGATEDGLWYYAMELLEGQTLGALVKENGPLPPRRAVIIALQAARALTEAHEHGIIHRDIKPENLFIVNVSGEGDFVKLLDFGIAKDVGKESGTLTNIGALMGTPMYMAPEQVRNDTVDARTDVYSLGAVLYKALTGHPPFERKTSLSMLEAQLMEPASPPSVWLEVSPCLEAVVMKCLEKKPSQRFGSAAELAEALTTCLRAS
jgi:serine/threonine protein kinase